MSHDLGQAAAMLRDFHVLSWVAFRAKHHWNVDDAVWTQRTLERNLLIALRAENARDKMVMAADVGGPPSDEPNDMEDAAVAADPRA